jgi:phage terminase small subunit
LKKQGAKNAQFYYSEDYDGSTPLKNARQELYCKEYVIDCKQSGAAVRAGYTKGGVARRTAYRLMTYDYILKRIAYLQKEIEVEQIVTVRWVMNGLKNLAVNAKDDFCKAKAFELLGKHLAMFTDRREVIQKPKRIIIRGESGEIKEELR